MLIQKRRKNLKSLFNQSLYSKKEYLEKNRNYYRINNNVHFKIAELEKEISRKINQEELDHLPKNTLEISELERKLSFQSDYLTLKQKAYCLRKGYKIYQT